VHLAGTVCSAAAGTDSRQPQGVASFEQFICANFAAESAGWAPGPITTLRQVIVPWAEGVSSRFKAAAARCSATLHCIALHTQSFFQYAACVSTCCGFSWPRFDSYFSLGLGLQLQRAAAHLLHYSCTQPVRLGDRSTKPFKLNSCCSATYCEPNLHWSRRAEP
jgi:hypothetical protein